MRSDARANRDRVLAAAEEVFGAAGANGSTEEVARRAGVGVGTVFRHFPTKRDLLEATVVRHFEHLTGQAERLDAGTDTDARAALGAVIHSMVSTGATKLALINHLVAAGGMTPAAQAASRGLRSAVAALLERAQHAGTVRGDATVEEVYLLVRALAQVSTGAEPAVVDRAVGIVLAGLAAPPAPGRP